VFPESNIVLWVGAVDSRQYQDKYPQTATEQDVWLTVLHQIAELLNVIVNAATSHLLIRSADIESLLENLDVVNIPTILGCCTTGRKGGK
jgi:hypothetical protein